MRTAKRRHKEIASLRYVWRVPLACAIMALVTISSAVAQFPTEPPPPGELRPLEFPAFDEATLDNGLQLIVVTNHRLPIVSVRLSMEAGSRYDPSGLEGLADMVSELLTRGTETRTADEIAEEIESVGASIVASADVDNLAIFSTVLSENVELAFDLIGDIVLNSTFPEEELELARTRFLSGLQVERSDPAALATRFFAREVYGEHPYGRRETEMTMAAMTRADVQAFARTRLLPGGSLLVVAGDITLDRVRDLASQAFDSWQGSTPEPVQVAAAAPKPTEILLVHRPGSEQSNIRVGNLALLPGDDLFYPSTVANRILGGGTDARLFLILREQHGWTYGAFSSVVRRKDIGFFQANTEVGTPVTDSALTEMMVQLRRIGTEITPDSELVAAKGYLVGSFPLSIQTPQQVANQVATVRLLNLGEDYLETYRERLAAVEAPELMQAAAEVIKPDSAVVVVVGDGQAIYEKLLAIAPVNIIDVDGNPLTPADLTPEAVAPEYDMAHVVARRDSFEILVQGNAIGYQVTEVTKSDETLVYQGVTAIPLMGMTQQSTMHIDLSTMMPTSFDQVGQMAGQSVESHLVYEAGRVTGTVQSPQQSGTPETVEVDTTLTEGMTDATALQMLLPALPLSEGASLHYNAFDPSDGSVTTLTLEVSGPEEVTVPAGTFSAWKVEMTGGEVSLLVYVSADTPRRTVKTELVGQPIVIEFVSGR